MKANVEQEKHDAELGKDTDGLGGLGESGRTEAQAERKIADDWAQSDLAKRDGDDHAEREQEDDGRQRLEKGMLHRQLADLVWS